MRMPGIALLRRLAPAKPALSTRHREERLKLLATGLQNFGLALFLGIVVLPAFSASIMTPLRTRFLAFVVAGMAESLAFILLRYIPPPPGPQETPMDDLFINLVLGLLVAGASGTIVYRLWRYVTGGP